MPNELITKNNVNITPLIESLVELVKDKDATGELEDFQNCKLPNKDKEVNSLDIVKHLQSDIGYILKRLGLS